MQGDEEFLDARSRSASQLPYGVQGARRHLMEIKVVDRLDPERRSNNMRKIRGRNTKPELVVRRLARSLGYSGYRIHRVDIPGKPDLAWIGRKKVIFVNGCFWHSHTCKEGIRKPKSRVEYWQSKLEKNKFRDVRNLELLTSMGWKVCVIWECELQDTKVLAIKVCNFVDGSQHSLRSST